MTQCHFAPPNLDALPVELTALPRWVLWKALEKTPGSKPTKVPYQASGAPAGSTDPATWADFATVAAAYQRGGFTGVGFVLCGDGLAGVDIDHCRDRETGDIAPAAQAILDDLGAAYVEVSPSGTGLRAFGHAEALERGAKGKVDGIDLELYTSGRYLTLTGETIKRGALAPLQGFGALAQRLRAPKSTTSSASTPGEAATGMAESLRIIQTGDSGLHDALRDVAASWAATGMADGAIVVNLRAMMNATSGPRDERWKARYAEIPGLVNSARAKFALEAIVPELEARLIPLAGNVAEVFDELPHVVSSWLPVDEVTLLAGHGGGGKSYLALVLAVHVALGRPFGTLTTRQTPVLFVSCEDGRQVLQLRLKRICEALQLDVTMLNGKLHLMDASDMDSAMYRDQRGGQAGPTPFLAGLTGKVERLGVGLVIVDNASDTFAANEINRADVRGFVRALRTEIARPGRAVLLLAHVSKAAARNGREAGTEDYSGSSAWHNSVRSRLSLVPNKDGTLTVEHQKANLGPLAAAMPIARVAGGVPLPVTEEWGNCPAGEAVRQAQAVETESDKVAVLRALQAFAVRGAEVPTANRGAANAYSTLRQNPGWPGHLTRERCFQALHALQDEGRVTRAVRRGSNRKDREVFLCLNGSGEA